jgi:aspartyl-tRNA(Asn)/glutamyl-tRNA(Gln) amidotransferase subunit A
MDQNRPLTKTDNFWLAIPTSAAGKSTRGGRITPGEWERRTGLRLRFVYRRRGPSLLVAEAECGHLIGATLDTEPVGFSDAFRGAINYGRHAQGARIAAAYRIIAQAGSGARRALEGIDAILLPTAPQPAFKHGTPVPVNQADFTALANAAGLPAIAFPLPPSDLPLSAQLIGPAFSEGRLIGLARALTSEVS